ncbi:MAG TPA: hypothetical protein VGQ39_06135 [Pyrinomonadaceae bacterium]|nr:hypothetical protein [Pyrinomonadaceae bacterium]
MFGDYPRGRGLIFGRNPGTTRVTAIASSDSHRNANPIGQPTTHLAARTLSQTAILNAIRRGQAFLTKSAEGPFVKFEAEKTVNGRIRSIIGDEIRVSKPGRIRFVINTEGLPTDAVVSLISAGQTIRTFTQSSEVIDIECLRDAYYRIEVRDKTKKMLTLTNPIYVKVRQPR